MSLQDAKLILTPNGYKAETVYAVKPTDGLGDATVSRNTTKTRVNSSGLIDKTTNTDNVLAPDYLNGVCPALNVEGQATNLFKYSEGFNQADWGKVGASSVTANVALSPDGVNTTADKLIKQNGATNQATLFQAGQTNVTGLYTVKVFAKADGLGFLYLSLEKSSLSGVSFDLSNGNHQIIGTSNYIVKSTFFSTQGYYLLEVGLNYSVQNAQLSIQLRDSFTSNNFTGDGVSGVLIWGAQIEAGEATSYIPTTTAAVTRSADTVTIPIPTGTTEIIEKYEDGTTNTITTIPASPYTVPTGKRYEYILMR